MTESVRLLMVDDDVVDRLAIRRAIEQSGLTSEIDEASDADEALQKVAQRRYDCLLLDHDLPGTPGIELTRNLRAHGNLVPIVFVTGQQNEELLQAAVEAGVTDFFPKGDLSPRRLALRIRFAIRIGRAEAESARSLAAANTAARARDDVLAVVSHDLRGPLHAISLACEALREELPPPAMRYLGAIERASARAERLIADLLEASAIENGALQLSRHPVDAGSIIHASTGSAMIAPKIAPPSTKTMKSSSARHPTRPMARASGAPATPTMRLATTRGTTVIRMALMKIEPKGSIHGTMPLSPG